MVLAPLNPIPINDKISWDTAWKGLFDILPTLNGDNKAFSPPSPPGNVVIIGFLVIIFIAENSTEWQGDTPLGLCGAIAALGGPWCLAFAFEQVHV